MTKLNKEKHCEQKIVGTLTGRFHGFVKIFLTLKSMVVPTFSAVIMS